MVLISKNVPQRSNILVMSIARNIIIVRRLFSPRGV